MVAETMDLNSKEWYNGPVTRQAAVGLMEADGDFMLRDCISIPGDYVLTCMAKDGKVLHFKLNKVLAGGEFHYQFEGDLFQSAVELIEHHLITGLPISNSSNAVIKRARNHRQAGFSSSEHTRSQSSMSGDTNSTISSGGSAPLTKSGSRASLLKDSSTESQLKRFKSLPAGKIRRTKRKAPSPPKDQKPLLRNECNGVKPDQELPTKPQVINSLVEKAKKIPPPSLLEGVKLRRKKFSQMLPKPLNLRQRQSMHITDELRHHLTQTLTKDQRRYSMPRLLDDSEEEDINENQRLPSKLVRSPSDTSIVYLNQLTSGNPFLSSSKPRGCLVPSLPAKKRQARSRNGRDGLQVLPSQPPAVLDEAIYDCLPKPRSMLSDKQLQYNQIYDVPRNLLIPKELSKMDADEARSVSAFSSRRPRQDKRPNNHRQPLDCVSVCSFTTAMVENKLNRHGNFEDGLDRQNLDKPALPPKGRRKTQEDIYNIPRRLDAKEDGISLCSDFSFCSDCIEDPGEEEESSTVTHFCMDDSNPFRFSPTSFLSETSLSFQDFDDDPSKVENEPRMHEGMKVVSSVSSVSSVTLQGEDTISLGYDTTSLPEDPFPEGLPSSASSTIGSPVSSR